MMLLVNSSQSRFVAVHKDETTTKIKTHKSPVKCRPGEEEILMIDPGGSGLSWSQLQHFYISKLKLPSLTEEKAAQIRTAPSTAS